MIASNVIGILFWGINLTKIIRSRELEPINSNIEVHHSYHHTAASDQETLTNLQSKHLLVSTCTSKLIRRL